MNKKCGKCSKTVYPTEELKCLDKVWHKACFKCQVCNMTLNMKNYKGYDKFPYCNAHYPTTKHTAVADTPESRRIAQNTKIQSNIKYHEQFEKEKGTKISVADDPETERLKKNMQVVSNVAYHNTLQQKFAQDANRPLEATDITAARNRRNPGSISDYNPPVEASPAASRSQPTHVYNSKGEDYNQPARRQIGSIADYDPVSMQGYQPPPQQQQQPRNPALFSPTPYSPPAPQPAKASRGIVSKAMYDYQAADTDEVSFQENDIIINCEPVDDGWMYGTVERSGQRGMLPSNYVQRIN